MNERNETKRVRFIHIFSSLTHLYSFRANKQTNEKLYRKIETKQNKTKRRKHTLYGMYEI